MALDLRMDPERLMDLGNKDQQRLHHQQGVDGPGGRLHLAQRHQVVKTIIM